jgi:uncharacterized delta-60 repeat protein
MFLPNATFLSQSPIQRGTLSVAVIVFSAIIATVSSHGATIDDAFHTPLFTKQSPAERVVVLPDDSFFAFRSFTRLSGSPVGPIVKFQANGTRDSGFHFAGDYSSVSALTYTNDGHLIVAAAQQDKSGRNYYRILKLNADGSVDSTFNAGAGANDEVRSLLSDSNKVLAGGYFTQFDGQNRAAFLRLNADGSIDTSFAALLFERTNPYFPAPFVRASAIQPLDGKYLAGGEFTAVNSIPADHLVRLNTNGSVDANFNASGFHVYGANGVRERPISDLALQTDGKVLISGRYFLPNVPNQKCALLRLNTDGSLEHAFPESTAVPTAQAMKLLPSGQILYGEYYLYRRDADGNLLAGYPQSAFGIPMDPEILARMLDVDAQSSGSFFVAGSEIVNGAKKSGLAQFNANGTLSSFYAGEFQADSLPDKVAAAADGTIYVSGAFDRIDGQSRLGFARLKKDGTLDTGFASVGALGFLKIKTFCLQPDGKILVGGLKTSSDVLGYDFGFDRFGADGRRDVSFHPINYGEFSENAFRADLSPDGSFIVSSDSEYDLVNHTAIIRIGSDGSTDYNFSFGGYVVANALEENAYSITHVFFSDNRPLVFGQDGKFLAKYFDRTGKYHLVRVKPDGQIDTSFAVGTVNPVRVSNTSILVYDFEPFGGGYVSVPLTTAPGASLSDAMILPDGKTIVVGMFTKYNNTTAPGIVRLLSNGNIDTTFHPGGGAQWTTTQVDADHIPQIDSVERQQNGQLLITGNFEAYDGRAFPGIALLNSDGKPDPSFNPAIALRNFGPFASFPAGKLYRQGAGNYLVSGRYAKSGESNSRSLLRIKLPASAEALNISTRMKVETGDNVMIGGFIITGNQAKRVIVRAIGPSLASAGLSGALADPMLELHKADGSVVTNDNWRSTQQAEILATGLVPKNNFESAIVATLPPGNYTAIVRGKNNTTGIAVIEAYDLDQVADAQLANISSRGFVQAGDNVMIGGIIVGPTGTSGGKMLIRAIGPSLSAAGIANPLRDPTLALHNGNGQSIALNDNWKSTQQAAIQATGIPPANDKESAIVASLPPGNYTAIVRGKNNTTGVALVEAYRIQ